MAQDPLDNIAQILLNKSSVKQRAYRNVCKAFDHLINEAHALVKELNDRTADRDTDISLQVEEVSKSEFHIRIAGDLLVFILHTNIITLSDEYEYNKSEYVAEKPLRKYLGQINVYNFMADSLEYSRLNDPGYLLSRLLINYENRFIVEGDRQIGFMFKTVSGKALEITDLTIFIKLIIAQAAENDLVAPPFSKIRKITVKQKLEKTQLLGAGNKIGFQMSYQNDLKA